MPLSHSADTSRNELERARICDLGLSPEASPLSSIVAALRRELAAAGICKVTPDFYLSREWGVADGSIAIALPFYLARDDLVELHRAKIGFVEGDGPEDVMRYLRHEMGHVLNYAYLLHEQPEWRRLFGSFEQDYHEDYVPRPFARDYPVHLPGWYAQKHPDEDWAETFAVWLTFGSRARQGYADAPAVQAKLDYCQRTIQEIGNRIPAVARVEFDEPIESLTETVGDFYRQLLGAYHDEKLPGLRRLLLLVADSQQPGVRGNAKMGRLLSVLIRQHAADLTSQVFQWTGLFPERAIKLIERLADEAESLGLIYEETDAGRYLIRISSLITALSSSLMRDGKRLP